MYVYTVGKFRWMKNIYFSDEKRKGMCLQHQSVVMTTMRGFNRLIQGLILNINIYFFMWFYIYRSVNNIVLFFFSYII